jgi:hypothetical protein
MSGDIPVMEGFRVERDPLTDEWVATSPSATYKIRGRSQAELNAARWELYGHLIEQFRMAAAELFPPDRKASLPAPAVHRRRAGPLRPDERARAPHVRPTARPDPRVDGAHPGQRAPTALPWQRPTKRQDNDHEDQAISPLG